jgi:signal transduction histidine kinase
LKDYQPGRSLPPNWWWLSRANGLANKVCSGIGQPTAMQAPDGRLWFPNGDALASFDPTQMAKPTRLRSPLIEKLMVDGLPQSPDREGRLRVVGRGRRLDLHYTCPNTTSPELPQFWHWMKGVDTNWVEMERDPLKQRTSSYFLVPGRYEFKVAVSDPSGSWQELEHGLKIEVSLPFWEQRSVQVFSLLLLLATVAGIAWRVEWARSRRRLEHLELQRAMSEERQRIARDIHDDLGSGLTEIIMEGDHLREHFPQTPASEDRIRSIAARARALTRAMDEVVWSINPRNDTVESLLTYLNNFAQEYLMRSGGHCRCDAPKELSDDDLPISAAARHNLYLASKEALHNIVKHAGGSEVWIRLQLGEAGFTLTIEDNGRGFDTTHQTTSGHGLQNMRQRLENIGGRCEIASTPGVGTTVKFFVAVAPQKPPAARHKFV